MYDTCLFHLNAMFRYADVVSKVKVEPRVFIYFVTYTVTL